MALYFDYRYAIHKEFVLGYLAMFLACIAKCWRSLERQFTYRKRTDRVAFPLEYSPKVYQSTKQVYYYA